MDIFLDPESAKSLTGQLYEQLRRAITEGRLLPGDQLVPSRQLAGELSVSRHTVTTAYGRLVAEGYADGHAGGGSVVASAYPAPPMAAGARAPAGTRGPAGTGTRGPAGAGAGGAAGAGAGGAAGAGAGGAVEAGAEAALRPSPRFAGWSPYFRPPPYGCRFDLRPGIPDPSLFPAAMWRRRVAAAVAAEHREYGDPAGRIRLRRAIAGWVARSRSVRPEKTRWWSPPAPSMPSTWSPGSCSSPATASRSRTPGTCRCGACSAPWARRSWASPP